MPADPVLSRLVAEAERTTAEAGRAAAALRAYLDGAPAEPASDFVSLKDAEGEFGRSNKQLRRWANEEGLGIEIDGRIYLRRSLIARHKSVQACLPTMSK